MSRLTHIETFQSKQDKTRKFVYHLQRSEGLFTIEVGVIDKGDGKDIFCIPTQTNCHQACRFCHSRTIATKVPALNLTADEICEIVWKTWDISGLAKRVERRPLLVSMMGLGEPLANLSGIATGMKQLMRWAADDQVRIRFGLATSMPKKHLSDFELLTDIVLQNQINLKVHLSLHYTQDDERRYWMPNAAPIALAFYQLGRYQSLTCNAVEVHYTLISGVNDTFKHLEDLGELFGQPENRGIPIKFLHFNPVEGEAMKPASDTAYLVFQDYLNKRGVKTEYYKSPGQDISACCGAFMSELYTSPQRRPTIAELETILNSEGEEHLEVLPNGEVRAVIPEGTPVGNYRCASIPTGQLCTSSDLFAASRKSMDFPVPDAVKAWGKK